MPLDHRAAAVYAHMLLGTRPGRYGPDHSAGETMTISVLRARVAIALTASAALTLAMGTTASADSPGGWVAAGSTTAPSLTSGEGVASLADGTLLYRGLGSIPVTQRGEGWGHVGDLDVAKGYIFDAYQGGDSATSKMYLVTTPGGQSYEYTHPLDAGEELNNSFDAVSPDAQWMVSGEWGDMNRLQVFPAPLLNSSTPATGGTLAQAGQITLNHTVNNIQGCDFVSGTRLVCASDDANKDVIQVDLPHALDGTPVTGQVSTLFQLPQESSCSGTFEAEGIDYDPNARVLRVEIVPPSVCEITTTVYSYTPTTG